MSRTEGNEPEIEKSIDQSTESAGTTPQSEPAASQEREVAAPKRPWYKRIRWWGWTLIGIFAVFVAFFGTFGVQAMMVKNYELGSIYTIRRTAMSGNVKELPNAVSKMQENTRKANRITHNGLWNFIGSWPGMGSNIGAAQDLTQIVEDVSQDVMPKYMDIASNIMSDKLFSNGQVNIKPVTAQYVNFVEANSDLMSQLERINDIPKPSMGVVRNLVNMAKGYVGTADGLLKQAETIMQDLPSYLGYKEPQTYAVMAMTPAEMRMSGGLIGAIGTLTLNKGKIEIGEFLPNDAYVKEGGADVDLDTKRIFMNDGPLYMSYDVRDLANFTDTEMTANAFLSLWKGMPWGEKTTLNGIIMVDPVVVQALVKVTGDVKLPDGTVLNGNNTAQFMMNTVYTEHEPEETNAYFGIVAKACVGTLMKHLDMKTIGSLAKDLRTLAKERHLAMYSFTPSLEELIKAAGFSATLPTDKVNPTLGVYLTEQNPSKMGWYIKRSTKIKQICTDSAPYKYQVEYTLENTLKEDEVGKLSWYITGQFPYNEGASLDKVFFYPPYGGELSNFKVQGTGSVPAMDSFNAAIMYRSLAQVRPEQKVTYTFDVTTSKQATSRLAVDQTPMGTENTNVEYLNSCPVN